MGYRTIESNNRLCNNPGMRCIEDVAVPMRRLDELMLQRVSFKKFDVEGHEFEVLKGTTGLLATQKPVLLIEIEERHCAGDLQRERKWLGQFGYRVHCFDKSQGKLTPVTDVQAMASDGVNNLWFLPDSAA